MGCGSQRKGPNMTILELCDRLQDILANSGMVDWEVVVEGDRKITIVRLESFEGGQKVVIR